MFGKDVNDKAMKVTGGLINTQDVQYIPFNIKYGLPYMYMWPCTDYEWEHLLYLISTIDSNRDTSILNNIIDNN